MSFRVADEDLTTQVSGVDYLSRSPVSITLDGVTKNVNMPTVNDILDNLDWSKVSGGENGDTAKKLREKILNGEDISSAKNRQLRDDAYIKALQANIDDKFGKLADGSSKLRVSDAMKDEKKLSEDGAVRGVQLKFEAGQKGSTFAVTSDKGKSMGFGGTQLTSYLNTNKTLEDLLDPNASYKAGVQQDTTGDIYLSDTAENGGIGEDRVVRYKTGNEAVQALLTGKVDCVVIDQEPAKAYVETNNK